MPRRRITLALALLLAPLAAPPGALAGERCPNAELQPNQAQLPAFARALVCLVNRERVRLARPPLRRDSRLGRAARRQAIDMVEDDFFSHFSQAGGDMGYRLRRAGYVPRTPGWMVGEVLSWGLSSLSTPRAAVDAWLQSPPHRRALLEPRFRQIGAGATIGTPVSAAGVTVAVDLGRGG